MEKAETHIEITLPQKAIDYYNKKFDDKLFYLTSPKPNNTAKEKSSIDHMYSQTIDYNDIHNLNLSETDAFGNKLSQYFTIKDKKLIGLDNDQYLETASLIKDLARRKEIWTVASEQFIHQTVFNWFKEKYEGVISIDSKFCDYLIEKIKEEIKAIITHLENIRKKYQGNVYSSIKVNAEKNRAIEIAKNETEKAINILEEWDRFTYHHRIFLYILATCQLFIQELIQTTID